MTLIPKLFVRRLRPLGVAAALTLGASLAWAQDVTGAGASFPAPIYAKWADAYNKATGAKHQLPVGGLFGAGIKTDSRQDGGLRCLDVPLTDD